MPATIQITQLERSNPDLMVACASDLGWEIGYWPSHVELQNGRGSFCFDMHKEITGPDGEFQGFVYRHVIHASKTIHVLND